MQQNRFIRKVETKIYFKTIQNMKKAFLIVFLMLAAATTFAQNAHPSFEKGKQAYDSKKYDEAMSHLDKAISENPEDFSALFYRALTHYYSARYEQAITDFTKCIELQPTRADLYYYRGLAKQATNKKDDAYNDLIGATILDTANGDYFYKKGEIAFELKKYTDAAVDFDKAARFSASATDVKAKRKMAFAKLTKEDIASLAESEPLAIAAAGADSKPKPDDKNTIAEKKFLEETTFASLADARSYYNQLNGKTGFAPGKKSVLLALARQKALRDVYGKAPFKEDLEDMYNTINRESYWLNPDGMKYYFQMIESSPYYFSGGVEKQGSYFYYKVTRSKKRPDYDVAVYQVKNKLSNLVYNSSLLISEDSTSLKVLIYQAENKGYMWKKSTSDYLQVVQSRTDSVSTSLTYSTVGGFESKKDASHGLPKSKYESFTQPKDRLPVSVMKAGLNTLILDYPKLFALK